MTKSHLVLSVLVVFLMTVIQVHAADTPKSLVLMLDGARSDATLMADTPNIDSLADGSWSDGYRGCWSFFTHTIKDAPPNSAPNHAAIVTGVTADKSQVKDNAFFEDYVKKDACATYKNCLARINEKYPDKAVAFVYSWQPDIVLASDDNPIDLVLQGDDGLNAKRVTEILAGTFENDGWQKGNDIDALIYYIDLPDAFGHQGGFSPPCTKEKHDYYLKSIETIDGWLGKMLTVIKNRPGFQNENWQIVICSDHGGWIGSHGYHRADTYTVPLVISGKDVEPGEMPGTPCTTDVAATVLEHFGFDIAAMKKEGLLDGNARGKRTPAPVSDKSLEDGLIAYLPFDGDVINEVSDSITPENRGAKLNASGGKRNGYLSVRPADAPQYVTLGNPAAMKWGKDFNFTVAFWVRMKESQKDDPVLLGNKNWTDGKNAGVCFFAFGDRDGSNNIGLNLADISKQRVDVRQFNIAPGEWWFCAATIDRPGNAVVYAGSPDGKLFFGNESLIGENLGKTGQMTDAIDSPLPWNIGQDGTGEYGPQLNADIDEMRIWNRALTLEEIKTLFALNGGVTPTMPERGICAHRGVNSTHPENTIPAFEEALRRKAQQIEFDVDRTKDNRLVIMHDATVDRTTDGKGRVRDLTFEQIRALDAGSWKNKKFAGTRVPTLEETLEIMPRDVWLNVHMKGDVEAALMTAEIIVRTKRVHQAFLACPRASAQAVKGRFPEVKICNMERQVGDPALYARETIARGAEFLQFFGELPPFEDINALKKAGVKINYFPTKSPVQFRELIELGIDFPLVDDFENYVETATELGITF